MSRFNLDDYEPVEDRLAKFWADHPDGRVWTEPVEIADDRIVFRAAIFRNATDDHPWSTGFAAEKPGEGMVNKTSALENCETSAVGRALANAGYAPKGARPSREEMEKVHRSEGEPTSDELMVSVGEWIDKALEAGVEVDAEKVRSFAVTSKVNAERAVGTLRERIDAAGDQ